MAFLNEIIAVHPFMKFNLNFLLYLKQGCDTLIRYFWIYNRNVDLLKSGS